MLAIVSDLHITDGTTANNINPESLGILADRIESSSRQRGAKELRLVLLGDILDLVRTDYWHRHVPDPDDRPWGGRIDSTTGMNADSKLIEGQFRSVLNAVIAADGAHSVDRAPGLARLLDRLERHCRELSVPFYATYVVGNHDRVLHNFKSLRQRVRAAFPQITTIGPEYRNRRYGLVARHGHEWEANNHGFEFKRKVLGPKRGFGRFDPESYQVMALGEVVTAELLGGLVYCARREGASPALVRQLKEVNNLRPLMAVFEWLDWIGGANSPENQRIMHKALKTALDGVLDSAFAKKWDKLEPDLLIRGDLVDRLQWARRLLLGDTFGEFRSRAKALHGLAKLAEEEDDVLRGARVEFASVGADDATLPDWTQFLVYGHTHRARRDYVSAKLDGRVQMYVNTGTYLPLITRTDDAVSFATERRMTLTFLYRADEDTGGKRSGPSIDLWSGVRRKRYSA